MQCWTTNELKNKLENAGFSQYKFYGDYSFDTELGKTDKNIVIAR